MPKKPTLEQQVLFVIGDTPMTKEAIKTKVQEQSNHPGDIVVSPTLRRLVKEGKVIEKNGKFSKVTEKNGNSEKEVRKGKVKEVPVTEATVKADLDLAIQKGDVDMIGKLLVQVFDGFVHEKSGEFFKLRYMANWCRSKKLSGDFIGKAYALLVGHFMPFVLKLRSGEMDFDTDKDYVINFTDDAGSNHQTKVRAVSPAAAIVNVRKSQRNGFHLTSAVQGGPQ